MNTKNTLWFGLGGLLAVLMLPTVFVFILWVGDFDHLGFWWFTFASLIFAAAVSTPLYLMPAVPNWIAHIAVFVCLLPVMISVVMLGRAYLYEQAPMAHDAVKVRQADYDVDVYEEVRPTGTGARIVNATRREEREAEITAEYDKTFEAIKVLRGKVADDELDARTLLNQQWKDQEMAKLDILYPLASKTSVSEAAANDSVGKVKASPASSDESSSSLGEYADSSKIYQLIQRGWVWCLNNLPLAFAWLVVIAMWLRIVIIWKEVDAKILVLAVICTPIILGIGVLFNARHLAWMAMQQ